MYHLNDIATHFSPEFLEAIKVLSNHEIYKVPIRKVGITSGQAQRCYWNASIVSQTWGGEVVYGYIVDELDSTGINFGGTIRLLGHGVWKNPEGQLVDVTQDGVNPNSTHRYFLPVDLKLVLNGVASEQLKNLTYVASEYSIPVELKCKVSDHVIDLQKVFNFNSNGYKPFMSKGWMKQEASIEKYLGKIVLADAWPDDFVHQMMRKYAEEVGTYIFQKDEECKEKYGTTFWDEFQRVMNPVIQVITGDYLPLKINDDRPAFNNVFWDNFYEAIKERTTVLDRVGDLNIFDTIFIGNDAVWDSGMLGDKTSIKNPSTATGKSIHDYSPRSLENVTLPRNKSKRRKVQKTANKYGMTVEQVLVLSDPFLWPHPNLIKETGLSQGTFKSFSRV